MSEEKDVKKSSSTSVRDIKTERHSMRLYKEDYQMLTYWSKQYDMDRTEFLILAMHHYIKWRNQDYDLPTAEVQRLNQMVDAVQNLAKNQENLAQLIVNGFDSVLGITRGDNYLIEAEDGALNV